MSRRPVSYERELVFRCPFCDVESPNCWVLLSHIGVGRPDSHCPNADYWDLTIPCPSGDPQCDVPLHFVYKGYHDPSECLVRNRIQADLRRSLGTSPYNIDRKFLPRPLFREYSLTHFARLTGPGRSTFPLPDVGRGASGGT